MVHSQSYWQRQSQRWCPSRRQSSESRGLAARQPLLMLWCRRPHQEGMPEVASEMPDMQEGRSSCRYVPSETKRRQGQGKGRQGAIPECSTSKRQRQCERHCTYKDYSEASVPQQKLHPPQPAWGNTLRSMQDGTQEAPSMCQTWSRQGRGLTGRWSVESGEGLREAMTWAERCCRKKEGEQHEEEDQEE